MWCSRCIDAPDYSFSSPESILTLPTLSFHSRCMDDVLSLALVKTSVTTTIARLRVFSLLLILPHCFCDAHECYFISQLFEELFGYVFEISGLGSFACRIKSAENPLGLHLKRELYREQNIRDWGITATQDIMAAALQCPGNQPEHPSNCMHLIYAFNFF